MSDRAELARDFLSGTSWARAIRRPLAGDASNRKYERLTDPDTGATAVLMDAAPEKGEDVRPFLHIARHLAGIGLSAPEILAEDTENGFLVIEDLGDALFARVIPAEPQSELMLYTAATDVLVHLHRAPLPRLAAFDPPLMTELAELAFTRYQAATAPLNDSALAAFRDRFETILRQTTGGDPVLIQRDFHAENLIWLPDRAGVARVGLLDFQDAMAGHPAYDLVSLLQDARRDVPAGIEAAMIRHYVAESGCDDHGFRTAYAVLGVQRNLRILGVFARLCTLYAKPHYLALVPRVWDHVMRGLEHPALAPVSDLLRDALPAPTPETLNLIRSQCPVPAQ